MFRTAQVVSAKVIVSLGVLAGFVVPSIARADNFKITYEAAGVQSANTTGLCANSGGGTCVVGTENFNSRTSNTAFTTDYGTNNVIKGSYTAVQINAADQYGGAGGNGQYAVAYNGNPYSVTLTTTLSTGLNYFGYWLSALDAGNQVTFFKGNTAVYSFTPSQLINSLGSCSGTTTNPYCGNPNSGKDTGEQFAFVNFFDTNGTFDKVSFSQGSGTAGYESDNHTVGYVTSQSGTAVTPEPKSLILVGSGLVFVAFSRRRLLARQCCTAA